jgi:hypothetical protein
VLFREEEGRLEIDEERMKDDKERLEIEKERPISVCQH